MFGFLLTEVFPSMYYIIDQDNVVMKRVNGAHLKLYETPIVHSTSSSTTNLVNSNNILHHSSAVASSSNDYNSNSYVLPLASGQESHVFTSHGSNFSFNDSFSPTNNTKHSG